MMTINALFQTILRTGVAVLTMLGSARASTIISYTTNAAGTEFVGGVNSDVLKSVSGQNATLAFTPNASSDTGFPSGIDLGDFLLVCATCTTNQDTNFGGFTFDLIVTDTTDGATGEFIGTSTGGTVSSNSSTIQIDWTEPPGLQLGPGMSYALSGSFNDTDFDLVSPVTLIVAPNSGNPPGDTRVQGQVNSTPEPTTFVLTAGVLLGLGMIRRRKSAQRA
jgi:hypothetical protein